MRLLKFDRLMLFAVLGFAPGLGAQTPAPAPAAPVPKPAAPVPAPVAPATTTPAPTARSRREAETSVPDISALLQKAAVAIEEGRVQDAEAALDGAKAVNPTQLGLWALYGQMNARRGDTATAVVDYRKELSLHPDFLSVYSALATVQISAKQYDEAATTLRAWQKAEPANPQPLSMLVDMLLNDGKAAEAVKAGEDGVATLPEYARNDGQLLFQLGSAELKVGHRDKGVAMLVQALRTEDVGLKNGVAYTLADAKVDIPLADLAERDVLERMSLVTEGWTLNENILNLLTSTYSLAAAWDTMGWILFREGKLPEAERYLRAAWRNALHGTIGEHLGEVEAARGNHRAALADYEISLAAIQKPDGAAPSGADAETIALLKQRIAAEQKAGVKSEVTDPRLALLKLRTFRLGAAAGRNGSAQYRVLLGRGKVVRSEAALRGGKTVPGGPELIAHAQVAEFFPNESYTQLVHVATLTCNGTTCDLVLDR